ncbi:hypothetical protein PPL_04894 [Heterostelium album PN500]|uniref:B box-type domain-containing protein n=1 Tax=Heterostelium pallidum (strain ATCC 26659 / Pp 5 / PN500) TaxID=670386 RepID=D3B8V1_HETP5|nr:hypothetical protein PPL_04894 [Heterostelium album PN500]EFA82469.1 hypothetical protein PPL_04894 [Heterostelium album PN500]|eukprot:XP_020434586.1 hypothetical protein PPL_04894 [Heterostelium album PN500]
MTTCLNHQRSHEFICYQCNSLMCSKCISFHNKDHPNHSEWEHIDDIKDSLSTLKLDDIIDTTTTTTNNNNHINNDSTNNSNNYNINSQIIIKLKALWESLRSSTSLYQTLTATENEIKQHFEQLHQYLIREEHKLQRDIINDKHTIENQIDDNIINLKYLLNVINVFNKLNNNDISNNSSNNSGDDSNEINNSYENQSDIEDATSLYSTTTIMESITTSSSLQSFINDNSQTLFNDYLDIFNIEELLKQHSNDSTSLLLDIIHKYNKSTAITNNNDNSLSSYKLTIKQLDYDQLDSIIERSIRLDRIESPISTTTNNNENKQLYIFTTHKSKGATLINTSNNYSFEELQFDYQFFGTYTSSVSVGEYIYIFGGDTNDSKWIRISAKSKSIEHIGDIRGINGDVNMSACYDGRNHIYLVNGSNKNRINRFNIKTMKFQSYYQLLDEYGQQVSSMIFKGSLYSMSYNKNKIFQLDLIDRTITDHQIDFKPSSACHDNNGNFYMLDILSKRFIKYNVETKQTTNLNGVPDTSGYQTFVMYHRESPTSSFIYSFGYSRVCNFKYSIESDQCEPFLRDIKNTNRSWCACASTSISL